MEGVSESLGEVVGWRGWSTRHAWACRPWVELQATEQSQTKLGGAAPMVLPAAAATTDCPALPACPAPGWELCAQPYEMQPL